MVHHNIIKIISMFYTVEALVKKSVVTGAGCLQEYYCSVPLVELDELNTSNFIRALGYKLITINFAY